ncbi:MsnO8 family LLM class oxidoreductase [Phenylobacterium aquaticum]|uniref:MsnO8 family LLM class oxidoreductase n=1 Tax=Phenylobacterium aquaticum TaxID=1763816 RepID=UPI001F5CB7C1|nr:MsnO8 family LLM class oxidoreductase [Phenylobacterium aquaticum]MCI3133948.1 MsnO8 family LLM class oxidoreductase [Phenylobacterium aquaticum]
MTATLSVLDLSPVSGDDSQAQAVRDTIQVAKAAERLGYHRFWVAEHHNIGTLGSPAPEILIAALTQQTSTIRLGSGGVMLVNYSPLKVAEVFMELEALAPGRIDLGVGRALGTDGRTGAALRTSGSEAFPHYFALLNAWLLDAAGVEPITDAHPAREIHANPAGPSHPDLFLLCSSPDSGVFAGKTGVGMVFAEFIAQTNGAPAVAAYRKAFEPSAFRDKAYAAVATIALAAETDAEAQRLAAPLRAGNLSMLMNQRRRFRSIPEAQAFLAEHADSPLMPMVMARGVVGEASYVRAELAAKAEREGVDELFVMAVGPDLPSRIRSLELIKPG